MPPSKTSGWRRPELSRNDVSGMCLGSFIIDQWLNVLWSIAWLTKPHLSSYSIKIQKLYSQAEQWNTQSLINDGGSKRHPRNIITRKSRQPSTQWVTRRHKSPDNLQPNGLLGGINFFEVFDKIFKIFSKYFESAGPKVSRSFKIFWKCWTQGFSEAVLSFQNFGLRRITGNTLLSTSDGCRWLDQSNCSNFCPPGLHLLEDMRQGPATFQWSPSQHLPDPWLDGWKHFSVWDAIAPLLHPKKQSHLIIAFIFKESKNIGEYVRDTQAFSQGALAPMDSG